MKENDAFSSCKLSNYFDDLTSSLKKSKIVARPKRSHQNECSSKNSNGLHVNEFREKILVSSFLYSMQPRSNRQFKYLCLKHRHSWRKGLFKQ